jgi:hypothetical protein
MPRETRPSLGPSTRARHPHTTRDRQTSRGEAFVSASRLGKPTQVGGTSTGARRADVVRLAACHRSRKREAWHVRKGRRSRPPSLRGNESSGFVGRTSCTLQKSPGDVWPRISSAYALQKGRSGSSERGPSSERGLAGQTVGRRIRRRDSRESASPLCRARIGARPRVARERHQRRRHRESGAAVAGPGS